MRRSPRGRAHTTFSRARGLGCCAAALSVALSAIACSLNLDELTGGGGIGGPEPSPQTTSGQFVPAEGTFSYVQNTSAYTSGSFGPDAEALGVDRLTANVQFIGPVRLKRPQAAVLPASVTYLPDDGSGACWTLHIDVHPTSNDGGHQEDESFCARDGGLFARTPRTTVQTQVWAIPGIGVPGSVAVSDCEPTTTFLTHDMRPGQVWQHHCTGSAESAPDSFISDGPYTYLGRELVTVAGVPEEARHTRRTRLVTGNPSGTEVTEFYFSVKDGLPLRIHRYTHIKTKLSIPLLSSADFDNDGSDWILRSRTITPFPQVSDAGFDAEPFPSHDASWKDASWKDAASEGDDAATTDADTDAASP